MFQVAFLTWTLWIGSWSAKYVPQKSAKFHRFQRVDVSGGSSIVPESRSPGVPGLCDVGIRKVRVSSGPHDAMLDLGDPSVNSKRMRDLWAKLWLHHGHPSQKKWPFHIAFHPSQGGVILSRNAQSSFRLMSRASPRPALRSIHDRRLSFWHNESWAPFLGTLPPCAMVKPIEEPSPACYSFSVPSMSLSPAINTPGRIGPCYHQTTGSFFVHSIGSFFVNSMTCSISGSLHCLGRSYSNIT